MEPSVLRGVEECQSSKYRSMRSPVACARASGESRAHKPNDARILLIIRPFSLTVGWNCSGKLDKLVLYLYMIINPVDRRIGQARQDKTRWTLRRSTL